MGEEGQGDVTVPAVPATDLVMREAHFPLRLLEADLPTRQRLPAAFASSSSVVPSGEKTV